MSDPPPGPSTIILQHLLFSGRMVLPLLTLQCLACLGTANTDGPQKQKAIFPLGEETQFRTVLFNLCSAQKPLFT